MGGLCPACLLKQGAAADTRPAGNPPRFVPPPVADLAPRFPQLELMQLIGAGGMGAVYQARQPALERIVALKILPPGVGNAPAFAERFTREARLLARLNHPGIVTLFDFGTAPATADQPPLYYFLMEYVDGVNLRQLLQTQRVSPREALAIVPQLCDALQYAHDQGLVHRDIKPENLLMDRRGRVKIADFGLARLAASADDVPGATPAMPAASLTLDGNVMGTPGYMAPEQSAAPGSVDHRADLYALGAVFYELLTGQPPTPPVTPPSARVEVDVRLDQIVLRALNANPALRFQQASAFKTEVESATRPPDLPPAPASRWTPGRKWLAAVGALLALAVVTAGLFRLEKPGPPPGPPSAPAAAADLAAAETAARAWLAEIDRGRYAESWNQTDAHFQSALNASTWALSLHAVRSPLGSVRSRTLTRSLPTTSLPGAPAGSYVVMTFVTEFEHKSASIETVTVSRDPHGAWLASGYYIR